MKHVVAFVTVFNVETTFALLYTDPLGKGVHSIREDFSTWGTNFLLKG